MGIFGTSGDGASAQRSPLGGLGGRLLIGVAIALIAVVGYCSQRTTNPLTGQTQYLSMTPQQEIAIGLQSAPEMVRQFGGISRDAEAVRLVDRVGQRLLKGIAANVKPEANPYTYAFHLLDDDQTVNAFALPGGQVFITEALLRRLTTEGQLAGVLGHEIGHVVGRHSAARLAKGELTNKLIAAVTVAASETRTGMMTAQQIAGIVGGMINMKYGREDELESDELGLKFMVYAGYDPRSMMKVMEVLQQASSGGGGKPEFMSTHPDPGRRIEVIEAKIRQFWPDGLPPGLDP